MTYGVITDPDVWDTDDTVDYDLGEWIRCPDCRSDDAALILWGEGVDMNLKCPDCGSGHGVR